jgi:hypothetical protein
MANQRTTKYFRRKISIPLESNLIIMVTGGRRTGKLIFYSTQLTN